MVNRRGQVIPKTDKKMPEGITRIGTPFEDQIEWTAEQETIAIEGRLSGRALDKIFEDIVGIPYLVYKHERMVNWHTRANCRFIILKVEKIFKDYRFEKYRLINVKSRRGKPVPFEEIRLLRIALSNFYLKQDVVDKTIESELCYLTNLTGRQLIELQKIVNDGYSINKKESKVILYFSGRCLEVTSRTESVLKKTNIMMSYHYAVEEDLPRLLGILEDRKRRTNEKNRQARIT